MPGRNAPKLALHFYRSASGQEPVREWLKAVSRADRHVIGLDLMRAQYRWPVGMPLCRPLGAGLWEVRSDLERGRQARVLFCQSGNRLVALHAFMKKTRTTPVDALALARARMKELAL